MINYRKTHSAVEKKVYFQKARVEYCRGSLKWKVLESRGWVSSRDSWFFLVKLNNGSEWGGVGGDHGARSLPVISQQLAVTQ